MTLNLMPKSTSILILHNIRSNHNVGSLFRTAECAGISKIILSGYTPTPVDKFGRPVKEIAKVALGAEKTIVWEKYKTLKKALENFKKQGAFIVGIEQGKNSIDYKKVKLKSLTVFILGNEVKGLSKKDIELCDVLAEIPMKGKKESLNVSVAGAVAIFRMLGI